jgi:hypothetical protein
MLQQRLCLRVGVPAATSDQRARERPVRSTAMEQSELRIGEPVSYDWLFYPPVSVCPTYDTNPLIMVQVRG